MQKEICLSLFDDGIDKKIEELLSEYDYDGAYRLYQELLIEEDNDDEEIYDLDGQVVMDEVLHGFYKDDYVYIIESRYGLCVLEDISELEDDYYDDLYPKIVLQGQVKDLIKSNDLNDIKKKWIEKRQKIKKYYQDLEGKNRSKLL